MLLAIDVGNTNITLGVFKGEKIIDRFRLRTKTVRTSDEYGLTMARMLKEKGIDPKYIKAVIIASVVPDVMYSLSGGIRKYFNQEPMIIGVGTKTGIEIRTDNPREIGADRIVDAVAAYEYYGGPVIVIDYGTATTYDVVTKDGVFVAGITAPGIRISADALWKQTAKLPEIEIKKPNSILAKNTITSMQAGLVYGCIGATKYIIECIKKELGMDLKVIATGGLGRIIQKDFREIKYDPDLTMKGLKLIYEKNIKNRK